MYDVLIIGGGIAGLQAALAAKAAGMSVGILSKSHPTRSHSVTVQDGINATMDSGDTWKAHAADTFAAGGELNNISLVNKMCAEAPALITELDQLGVPFNRNANAEISCLNMPGSSHARSVFVDDMSGLAITQTLFEQAVRADVKFHNELVAIKLITERNSCQGAVALELASGALKIIEARSTILATGTPRRLYEPSTSSLFCTGDGLALAYRVGVPLVDMEFVEYHPAVVRGSRLAITALLWSNGGTLKDAKDGSIVNGNWSPSHSEDMFFSTCYRVKQLTGTNMGKGEAVSVRPAMNRILGGIAVDQVGATSIGGLYAAGGCAGTGVHGATSLGGNALLLGIFSGKQAGNAAAEHAKNVELPIAPKGILKHEQSMLKELMGRKTKKSSGKIRQQLAELMHNDVGQSRNKAGLTKALKLITKMKMEYSEIGPDTKSADFNFALLNHLELGNLLEIAEVVVHSAQARTESRGVHMRSDYPSADQQWRKHISVSAREGEPDLTFDEQKTD